MHYLYPDRNYTVFRIGLDPDHENFSNIAERIQGRQTKVFVNTLDCLTEILNTAHYQDLPCSVNVDYQMFEENNIDLASSITMIKSVIGLMCLKFNRPIESLVINARIGKPISLELSQYLRDIGVDNLTPTPWYWGEDIWRDTVTPMVHGQTVWPNFLIDNNNLKPYVKPNSLNAHCDYTQLTSRQHEIAQLICFRGLSNKQIARQLGISESAVKMHITTILKKFGLKSRMHISLIKCQICQFKESQHKLNVL